MGRTPDCSASLRGACDTDPGISPAPASPVNTSPVSGQVLAEPEPFLGLRPPPARRPPYVTVSEGLGTRTALVRTDKLTAMEVAALGSGWTAI